MPDTISVTDVGEVRYATSGLAFDQKMLLFTNDITPGSSHSIGDFTQPPHTGYQTQDLNSWPAVATNAAGVAETMHPVVTFTHTGIGTQVIIKGLAIYDPNDNAILAVVLYENPVTLSGTGTHTITQALTARSDETV